jgi:hypothetical protein
MRVGDPIAVDPPIAAAVRRWPAQQALTFGGLWVPPDVTLLWTLRPSARPSRASLIAAHELRLGKDVVSHRHLKIRLGDAGR